MRWPAVLAWDPLVRQDALAPWFVLPDDGAGDWIAGASLSPRYIPHAVDPTHDRDLLDRSYLTDPLFDAPSSIDEIVAAGESRRVLH